jgi:EAL domain-containing protein (putative c-di-GMP-specific phosphodiesterase class I)
MILDPERTIEVLRRLRALGIHLSVDDLGTGYSSLSYLKQLPVNEVKLDKSFLLNMPDDKADEAIVEAVITLAHRLGMRVVAEGIETERTFERLGEMGCDIGQGYWISRPIPADDVVTWVRRWPLERGVRAPVGSLPAGLIPAQARAR